MKRRSIIQSLLALAVPVEASAKAATTPKAASDAMTRSISIKDSTGTSYKLLVCL